MKFAQSSAVFFNYSLQHAIRELAGMGYDGIEIWGGRPHMYRHDLDGQMAAIVALLRKTGLSVCNLIPAQFRYPSLLCSDNERVRRESVDAIKDAVENAICVGAPSVSLCAGMALWDRNLGTARRSLRKSLSELAEYGAGRPIVYLLEPAHRFESNLVLTVDDGLRMLDSLPSDRFGILLDTGHCRLNGESLRDAVKRCQGRPLHIHLDDNDGSSDAHRIPGEGDIDFAPLRQALEEVGYDGFISAELGTAYIMEPTDACRRTLTRLRGLLGSRTERDRIPAGKRPRGALHAVPPRRKEIRGCRAKASAQRRAGGLSR